MVATLLKLKLTLLKNSFKRSVWQIIGVIFGGLYALFVLFLLLAGLFFLQGADPELKRTVLVLAGAFFVLGWWILPILMSGMDQTLDPIRFTHLPLKTPQLLTGLAMAGFIGLPGIITVILVFSASFVWLPSVLAVVLGLVAAVLSLGLIQLGSRAITTFFSGVLGGRRGQEAITVLIISLAVIVGPTIAVIANRVEDFGAQDWEYIYGLIVALTDIVAWTPFGLPWQIPADIAAGNTLMAIVRLVYLAAVVLLLGWAWAKLFQKAAVSPPKESKAATAKTSRLGKFERGPISSIALRMLRYWRRDSRLVTSNVMVIILPVAAFAMYWLDFGINVPTGLVLGAGPIIAALYGWGMHNMLAYDGSAYWMHLSTGVRGKQDRLGRLITEGGTGLVIVTLVVIGGIALTGRWDMLIFTLVVALYLLCLTLAISTFLSTVWIYPVPAAGENPFSSSAGTGVLAVISQFVNLGVAGLLSLPAVIPFILVIIDVGPGWVYWLGVGAGVILGPIALWLGVKLGADRLDSRGPEVLVSLQKFS